MNSRKVQFCQKPEDKKFWGGILRDNGKPYIVIEEGGKHRINLIDTQRASGSDTLGLVEFMMTLNEALEGGKKSPKEPFWELMMQRTLFNTISALQIGLGKVSAPDMLSFMSSAANSAEQLKDPKWRESFHPTVLEAGYDKEKTPAESHDYELVEEFWAVEWPNMNDKTRSSVLASVMNVLHTFNTGLVRDICSSETTITPEIIEQGVSVIVNFPTSEKDATGRFINGGIKYLFQKYILRRAWDERFFNIMLMDEYQESSTSFDAKYLSQCRSHGGGLFCLTQSLNSYYASMSEHGHHHRADQLLGNFGTHIYHTVDFATAKFASEMLGQYLEDFVTINEGEQAGLGEQIMGNSGYKSSHSKSYQPQLQTNRLTTGLRNGSRINGYFVDGIVIRLGMPFRNGLNWQKVAFSQRR